MGLRVRHKIKGKQIKIGNDKRVMGNANEPDALVNILKVVKLC